MEEIVEPEVIVLFTGYSKVLENETMLANCTCSLIKGPPHVLVDTMTAWDGPKLAKSLQNYGLNCEDINYVISTHGHSDHIGCNYLFLQAKHIVGFSISHHDKYYNHDFKSGLEYKINDRIKIIATPGHTLEDVTVIVTNKQGVIAITGDLFENENDLKDETIWKNAGSVCEELQSQNRNKILHLADFIIPGHGAMFKVPK